LKNTVKIYKALSDPGRLRIMKMLEEKKLCVCEITYVLGLATSTVSKHLSLLRDADLIRAEKDGKWVDFFINNKAGAGIIADTLNSLKNALNDDEEIINDKKLIANADRNIICNIIE
jgi:ArsR family transcriptional regulator